MNAASAGFDFAACAASGCSAATAQNVTPMMVSARVVKTYIRPSPIGLPPSSRMSCVNANRTPRLLPIQFACIARTRSGQPVISVEIVEQLVGVVGDPQVVHRDLALLDRRARAPAAAVDHLLVREHRLVDGVPVDDARLLVGDALFEHLQEQPLVPPVVRGIAGRDLARPVDRAAHRLHLPFHVGDVVVGPGRRRNAGLHRGVLRGQAERVPAHRHQHVVPLHPQVPVHHVADHVVAHVPHVQHARGVGQHRHAEELLPVRCARRRDRRRRPSTRPARRLRSRWG